MAYRFLKWEWLKNANVKIISLLSALILWLVVISGNTFNHVTSVRLDLINKPTGWILKESVPDFVRVRVRGTGIDLLLNQLLQRHLNIDLEDRHQNRTLRITPQDIKAALPTRLESLQPFEIIEPESLFIQLDRFVEKKAAVTPSLTLNPLDGYVQVGPVKLIPDSILVKGPQILVNTIFSVPTDSTTVNNLLKPYSGKVELQAPEWETVTYSESTIRFDIDVQGLGERTLSDIPVMVINVPDDVKTTVIPSTLTLNLRGGVRLLAGLKREDFEVTIDYARRARYQTGKWPANIKPPPDVTFTDPTPAHFEVIIER